MNILRLIMRMVSLALLASTLICGLWLGAQQSVDPSPAVSPDDCRRRRRRQYCHDLSTRKKDNSKGELTSAKPVPDGAGFHVARLLLEMS